MDVKIKALSDIGMAAMTSRHVRDSLRRVIEFEQTVCDISCSRPDLRRHEVSRRLHRILAGSAEPPTVALSRIDPRKL